MNQTPEQLTQTLKSVSMTADERTALRHMLEAVMQSTPARARTAGVWGWIQRHAVVSVAMLIVALMGTTTALASTARQDDFLYPLRVAIVDRVQVALTSDEDARIDVELSQIDRMIADEATVGTKDLSTIDTPTPAPTYTPHSSLKEDSRQATEIDTELHSLTNDINSAAKETPPSQ